MADDDSHVVARAVARERESTSPGPRAVAGRGGPWVTRHKCEEHTRELARRLAGTLEVRLVWSPDTDRLCVCVRDASNGNRFRLEVGAVEAMEVFHHPYAYAAARGIEYRRDGRAETVVVDV